MIRLGKKYWIAIVCKMLMIASSFLISIVINRGLGVVNKGEYAYVINLVELLYGICNVGIGQAYSTFKRTYGDSVKGIFVFLGYVHFAGTLFIGMTISSIFDVEYGMTIAILTSIATLNVIISMLAVIEESIKRNIIQAGINFLYLFVLVVLYYLKLFTLRNVFLCYGLNELVRILVLIKMYRFTPTWKGIEKSFLKKIYRIGIMTMFVNLLISLNYSVDVIMLKKMTESYYVGIYSVAVTFSNMFLLIPDSFKEVLFGDSTKKNFSSGLVYNSIKVSVITSGIILCGFALLGRFAISFLYGKSYIDAYRLTLILFVGSIPMTFFKILQPVYISHGKQYKAAIFLTMSAITNIVINYILIPKLYAVGAAFASMISYTLCGVLFLIDYWWSDKQKMHEVK